MDMEMDIMGDMEAFSGNTCFLLVVGGSRSLLVTSKGLVVNVE